MTAEECLLLVTDNLGWESTPTAQGVICHPPGMVLRPL
jgi:hypothetical protein